MEANQEDSSDGVRFTWNVWPNTKDGEIANVVPITALYTPLESYETSNGERKSYAAYEPITCKSPCNAALNPLCHVDYKSLIWVCPFCLSRNTLPLAYKQTLGQYLPLELQPSYAMIDYILPRSSKIPPIIIFIVDICCEQEELDGLKDALLETISTMPTDTMVGLITYGTIIHVHELAFSIMSKSYVFHGGNNYNVESIQSILGLRSSNLNQASVMGASKFVLPLGQCEEALVKTIQQILPNPWPKEAMTRDLRATGTALKIATNITDIAFSHVGCRLILFTSGPCTLGLGKIVNIDLKESIRSHSDIVSNNAAFYKEATKFYNELADQIASKGHVVDIFVGCYDQVGLVEMKNLANKSGGSIILSDSFKASLFRQSFQKLLSVIQLSSDSEDPNESPQLVLNLSLNARLDIKVSKELAINGIIGPVYSLDSKTTTVSQTVVGVGGTSSWKIGALDSHTTLATYFEIVNKKATTSKSGDTSPQMAYIQFSLFYQAPDGYTHLRVTTVARPMVDSTSPRIKTSFDQDVAAVSMTRLAINRSETADSTDVLRWVDRSLIRFCSAMASYIKDDPQSFTLDSQFEAYPQYMFHLRRGQFLTIFNSSPDETAFVRHCFLKEDLLNSLTMIQPTITTYKLGMPPTPALLDAETLDPDAILLLDTFFHIVIYRCENVGKWVNEGFHEYPGYEYLKDFLNEPLIEAKELLNNRFPIPRFVVTSHGDSQGRFLLSKLNPSTNANRYDDDDSDRKGMFTDDVSLQVFVDHLRQLVVSSS